MLVWQRPSTGAQTSYLLWALKLLSDFNHWLFCASCRRSPLQQGWESKKQAETCTYFYLLWLAETHLQTKSFSNLCPQLEHTPKMRVSTSPIILYIEEGSSPGHKETPPNKKSPVASQLLGKGFVNPSLRTSPGHALRIAIPVAVTPFCCSCVLVRPTDYKE